MSNQEEILIIGGGVIGVCTAYYLARQDRSVTLIEKDDICAGSSYGNVGWIATGHATPMAAPGVLTQGLKWLLDAGSPFYIKPRFDVDLVRWLWLFQAACNEKQMHRIIPVLAALNQASSRLFAELALTEKLDFGYESQGMLHLFNSHHGFKKGVQEAALLQEFGITSVELDRDGVREIEPNVLPAVANGIYVADHAHIRPDRFVREMARLAEHRGVRLRTNTEVLGLETSGRRISAVNTTRGTFKPEQVVLAAGAWSALLARELGLRIPVQPAKGYSITVKSPPTCPRLPLALTERKVAVTPMGGLLRFSSTLELAGFDSSINRRRLAATRQGIGEYLSGMTDLEVVEIWRGFRPATPDSLPIIGRSNVVENLILATGHGMLGMTHGPITGQLVSQIIANEPPAIDLTPLRAERFR
jgi:D-amino-acid dehydrogenase